MKRLTKTATGRLKVRLGGRHRDQLLRAAKTHSKPQIRERAAAILYHLQLEIHLFFLPSIVDLMGITSIWAD